MVGNFEFRWAMYPGNFQKFQTSAILRPPPPLGSANVFNVDPNSPRTSFVDGPQLQKGSKNTRSSNIFDKFCLAINKSSNITY